MGLAILTKYILHFEPIDINAESPEEAEKIYQFMNSKPTINKVLVSRGIDHDM